MLTCCPTAATTGIAGHNTRRSSSCRYVCMCVCVCVHVCVSVFMWNLTVPTHIQLCQFYIHTQNHIILKTGVHADNRHACNLTYTSTLLLVKFIIFHMYYVLTINQLSCIWFAAPKMCVCVCVHVKSYCANMHISYIQMVCKPTVKLRQASKGIWVTWGKWWLSLVQIAHQSLWEGLTNHRMKNWYNKQLISVGQFIVIDFEWTSSIIFCITFKKHWIFDIIFITVDSLVLLNMMFFAASCLSVYVSPLVKFLSAWPGKNWKNCSCLWDWAMVLWPRVHRQTQSPTSAA